MRKRDNGVGKEISQVKWEEVVNATKHHYLSNPTKNLRLACRITARAAKCNGQILTTDYIYTILTRNSSKSQAYFSPYHTGKWSELHDKMYRKN